LLGVFAWDKLTATLAALGIILSAVPYTTYIQRIVYGPASPQMLPKLTDLNAREFAMLAPLVVLVFWIGLYPKPLLDVMHGSVERVLASQSVSVTVQQEGVSPGHVVVITEGGPHALTPLDSEEAL